MSVQPRTESPFANRTLVVVAVTLAVLAFSANFFYLNRIMARQERDAFKVVVAAQDLAADTILSERSIAQVDVPGVFRDRLKGVVLGSESNQIIGSPIRRNVNHEQVIFWEYINPDYGDSPARLIDPRYRGITVKINADANPTALLRPGGYVDLVGTVRIGSAAETMTILEYVKVVATGQVVQPQPDESGARRASRPLAYRDITLQLRPEDGEKLRAIEAHTDGRGFTVMVRNPSDDATRWGRGAFNPRLEPLLSGASPAAGTP